jgi:hypothetical protein
VGGWKFKDARSAQRFGKLLWMSSPSCHSLKSQSAECGLPENHGSGVGPSAAQRTTLGWCISRQPPRGSRRNKNPPHLSLACASGLADMSKTTKAIRLGLTRGILAAFPIRQRRILCYRREMSSRECQRSLRRATLRCLIYIRILEAC